MYIPISIFVVFLIIVYYFVFVTFALKFHSKNNLIINFQEELVFRYYYKILIFLFIFSFTFLFADDGMWMPHQLKMFNLEKQGLKLNPDDLYKPNGTGLMNGVINLGSGTGSFVSDKGLILTNHHVAFGAIQRASNPEDNYLQNGFLASSYSEEIQALGYTAGVLINYTEITTQIEKELKEGMTASEKYDAIDLAKKKIIKEAENEGPDIYAEIGSVYSGNQYYLFTYKKIKDLRIVCAPPRDLGNFGGEEDNWMWPRHTCDFTFLRAYVSPDGIGVEYHPDNVPYEPKVHFKIAKENVKENDFTFIMGYPGKTYRNYSTPELLFDIDKLKYSIEKRLKYIDFFEESSKTNEAFKIKYASMLKSLYNGLKNYRGKLEGFAKADLVNLKKKEDKKFNEWISRDESRKKYTEIINKIDAYLESEYKSFYWNEYDLKNLSNYRYGPSLLFQAHTIVRFAIERQKPDMERDAKYQDRNITKLIQYIKLAERRYDAEVDKNYMTLRLTEFLELPQDQIPGFIKKMWDRKGGIAYRVKVAYENTRLMNPDFRLSLMDKSPGELKALNDPLLDFAFELENELAKLREQSHVMNQKLADLKKIYIKGLLEMTNNSIAPDANSTIRFTSGPIKGYVPKDAVYYNPISTLKGVIEKDSGEYPFHVPEKLKTLYQQKDFGKYLNPQIGDVPACFLNTTNVTGGNSGSPAINANGEIIGCVFDMTYESVIGDYYIIPEYQRVISVDINYVLFVTEKFMGAKYLIEEIDN